ncbi:unnamed protein product [Closterium sp. NIES-64]|nr:unnamed protein product [Closterium sp. NIES-64]
MAAVSAATARVAMAAAPVQSAVLASSYSSRSSFAACPVSRPSRAAGAKRLPAGIRCHGEESEAAVDGRAFRRALNKSDNYNRSGFGYKKEMLERMEQEYTSDVVKTLRENNNEYTWGDVTVMLAESLGFCWGVERAVQMAYEARKQFPDQKIWVTNEIIHNPTVNDVRAIRLPLPWWATTNVVVLPAFGASLQEVTMFHDRNVQMVDTTCPWVSKAYCPDSLPPPMHSPPPPPYSSRAPPPNLPRPPVPPLACPVRCVCGEQVWDTVDKHKRGQFTSVIHGKYAHEETVATASYAGTYIVVKGHEGGTRAQGGGNTHEGGARAQGRTTCATTYMGGKLDGSSGTREEFLQASCSWLLLPANLLHVPIVDKFAKAVSKGFDPDTDLERLGIANQTTMLKGETEMIGKLLERTMMSKFGASNVNSHFMSFTPSESGEIREGEGVLLGGRECVHPCSLRRSQLDGRNRHATYAPVNHPTSTTHPSTQLNTSSSPPLPSPFSCPPCSPCPPTPCWREQERQDAMYALVERPMDLMIVVGGLNSSNTSHLAGDRRAQGHPLLLVDEPRASALVTA